MDCVRVCPYDLFEVRALPPHDRASRSLMGKMKAWAHGNRQASVVHGPNCHAGGLCIKACPEQALRLVPSVP